jgi:hypothetical protein
VSPPLYLFPPIPVDQPADEVHRRLTADPQAVVTAATAVALHRSAPLLRRWGLTPTSLPSTTSVAASERELGCVTIGWRGDEDATGWPATSAQLLVTPTGPRTCALTLATTRGPAVGLAAARLDHLHGRRAVHLAVSSFLRAVVEQVDRVEPAPTQAPEPVETAR